MCLLQLVGLESRFTHRIAPTDPVLAVPGMAANAGLLLEASPAKRHPAVCCCGALDFALDMVAIHVEKISTGGNGGNGENGEGVDGVRPWIWGHRAEMTGAKVFMKNLNRRQRRQRREGRRVSR